MRKLWLLTLLLAFLPLDSRAANVNIIQRCDDMRYSSANSSTVSCSLANNGANKIIVAEVAFGTAASITCTDACTCPAGATATHGYFGGTIIVKICYVDASAHATFTVTGTLTCSTCSGLSTLAVYEVTGLGSGSDSSAAASAAAKTVNFTSTNANEWAFTVAYDNAQVLSPASSFTANHQMSFIAANTTASNRVMDMFRQLTTATTYTTSYTDSTSTAPMIVVLPFDTSGGSTPSVKVMQSCSFELQAGTTPVTAGCPLSNTTSGNKVIFGYYTNATAVANVSQNCTETCVCPTNSAIHHQYTSFHYTSGICYSDTASNDATFDAKISISTGNAISFIYAQEVNGLSSSDDSGAEANAAATSVSYTTSAGNEMAYFFALDNANNIMAPASGFSQVGWAVNRSNQSGVLWANQLIAAAGTNTASYTQTGAAISEIMVIAFGAPALPTNFPMVIKYRKTPWLKIPWDNRRRRLEIITI